MKRSVIILVAVLLAVTLAVGGSVAMAKPPHPEKPPHAGEGNQLIPRPNGFPAGPHFNLNIHGKKLGYACNETPGGGSVFVDEYGPATIQYVTNKKSSVTNLIVLDPCAVENGTAKVQLPYEADGYFVFGRILGKPNHGKNGNASSVILYPNVVVQACNDTGYNTSAFANLTSCPGDPLLALGFILYNQVYLAENETTAIVIAAGKNVTDYDCGPWGDCNGTIDLIEEWLAFQADLDPPMAWYYAPEDGMWIFNIADLVVTEQGLVNDGTKLLQIRFYPKDGTTFE